MRFLFVIDNLGSGGAQRQLVNLAIGMRAKGHDIDFFIYYPQYDFFKPYLEENNIKIFKTYKKRKFDISLLAKLKKVIDKGEYDLIVSFLEGPNFYCELLRIFNRKIKLIVSERISYIDTNVPIIDKFRLNLHRLASVLVTNSYYLSQQLKMVAPFLKDKIFVIYNGLDLNKFCPRNNETINNNRIIGVGSIIRRKNIVALAKALQIYKTKYGDPPIIEWAGTRIMNKESDDIYKEVRIILQENKLEDKWIWLGECRNLEKRYPRYCAMILPSIREGLSNVVCEAMACGVPVLISNIGENRYLIERSKGGLLFNPYSYDDIAQVLFTYLKKSESEKKEMGIRGRRFAEENFSLSNYIKKYEELIVDIS